MQSCFHARTQYTLHQFHRTKNTGILCSSLTLVKMLPKISTKETLPCVHNSFTKRSSYNEHSLQNPWFEDVEHLPKPDPVYLDDLQIKDTKHEDTFNSLLSAKPDPSNDNHRPLDRQGKVRFAPSRPRRYFNYVSPKGHDNSLEILGRS